MKATVQQRVTAMALMLGTLMLGTLMLGICLCATAEGRTTLGSICHVKGQEENTLQGLGIVVGLDGTGDGANFTPVIRSLAETMTVLGQPLGAAGLAELKDAKNVALVTVTATIPAAGARQGSNIDCQISSIGAAKSLVGGRLFLTPLVGPDRRNPIVYAFAQGAINLDKPELKTTGRIFGGCRLEEDFFNAFVKDDKITLVMDKYHAGFQMAQDVAEVINSQLQLSMNSRFNVQNADTLLAKAIDPVNVEVGIPAVYQKDPVLFVSLVLGLPIVEPQSEPRVVINQRAGSIVISGNVEIGAVVVTHKNIVVETGTASSRFVGIDPEEPENPQLKALIKALSAVHVPTNDIIEIIKGIDRNGRLHGQLIIE
jgi:flagellar P-ring protein precursor FlgI